MNKRTKEELTAELNNLDIQLNRVIKLPELLDESEDRVSIDVLIDKIIDLTNELGKL